MMEELLAYAVNNWPDVANGTFEMAGGFFILLSILKLHKDKVVRGISWVHAAFFSSWGFWNLFYYLQLDQWWSWGGGVGLVLMNTVWLGQMAWYIAAERRAAEEFLRPLAETHRASLQSVVRHRSRQPCC